MDGRKVDGVTMKELSKTQFHFWTPFSFPSPSALSAFLHSSPLLPYPFPVTPARCPLHVSCLEKRAKYWVSFTFGRRCQYSIGILELPLPFALSCLNPPPSDLGLVLTPAIWQRSSSFPAAASSFPYTDRQTDRQVREVDIRSHVEAVWQMVPPFLGSEFLLSFPLFIYSLTWHTHVQ